MMPKTFAEFQKSLVLSKVPADWPIALCALWHDAKGNWNGAHDIAQDMHNDLGSWMHAYLHRKEGDRFNAGYWYRQAGKTFRDTTLEEELQELVEFVLS